MPIACETVTGRASSDVGPITVGDDIRDRRVVIIRKPVRRIPVIVDLFLRALERATRHRSMGLWVDIEIPLRN